jgi:hypothetical protein
VRPPPTDIELVVEQSSSFITLSKTWILADDTTNIHPDRGPINAMTHEAGRNPKIES